MYRPEMVEYLKEMMANPMFAGLIGGSVVVTTLWAFVRSVPAKLYNFIVRHLTISAEILGNELVGSFNYNVVDEWTFTLPPSKRRHLNLRLIGKEKVSFSPAPDSFVFFRGWRPFLFRKVRVERQNGPPEDRITIATIGRTPAALEAFFREIAPEPRPLDTNLRFFWKAGASPRAGDRSLRPFSTFVLPEGKLEAIIEDIQAFHRSWDWYKKRGLTYQKAFLFEGPPGTGKTSLAYSLGLALPSDGIVNVWNLSHYTDKEFVNAWTNTYNSQSAAPHPRIVIMDEIDTVLGARDRSEFELPADYDGIQLATLLAILDGTLTDLPGAVFIFTTNFKLRLDAALVRKGRIDHTIKFDYYGPNEVYRMALLFLEDEQMAREFAAGVVTPAVPADVQASLMEVCGVSIKQAAAEGQTIKGEGRSYKYLTLRPSPDLVVEKAAE